jgi:hypothetical protein
MDKLVVIFEHGRKDRLNFDMYEKQYIITPVPVDYSIERIKSMTEMYCILLSSGNVFYSITKIKYHTTINTVPVVLKVDLDR